MNGGPQESVRFDLLGSEVVGYVWKVLGQDDERNFETYDKPEVAANL